MASASVYSRAAPQRSSPGGLRWDRVGRLAMIAVIVALVALYIRSGISLWSAWNASRGASAKVLALQAQNEKLKRQRSELHAPWVTEPEARRLGMAHPGEKTYVITHLPRD